MNPKISISIATYEAKGNGLQFIKKNIESFLNQTYKNLELVISDHSVGNEIEEYVNSLAIPNIVYIRNEKDRGSQVENINNAILHCSGDFIKIMNHDDYMESSDTIESGVVELNNGAKWVIYSSKHIKYKTGEIRRFVMPKIESGEECNFLNGLNHFGCPSVGLIPKGILLDVNVKYFGDCELWFRLIDSLGYPNFVEGYKIVIGLGDHSLTHKFSAVQSKMIKQDSIYCKLKFKDSLTLKKKVKKSSNFVCYLCLKLFNK